MPTTIPFQSNAISISTTPKLLVQIPTHSTDRRMSFEIASAAGSAAINHFFIKRQLHDNGSWLDYFRDADFETITPRLAASSPGPHVLTAGQSAWVDVDCGAAVAVQLWASVASGIASITVLGGSKQRL